MYVCRMAKHCSGSSPKLGTVTKHKETQTKLESSKKMLRKELQLQCRRLMCACCVMLRKPEDKLAKWPSPDPNPCAKPSPPVLSFRMQAVLGLASAQRLPVRSTPTRGARRALRVACSADQPQQSDDGSSRRALLAGLGMALAGSLASRADAKEKAPSEYEQLLQLKKLDSDALLKSYEAQRGGGKPQFRTQAAREARAAPDKKSGKPANRAAARPAAAAGASAGRGAGAAGIGAQISRGRRGQAGACGFCTYQRYSGG